MTLVRILCALLVLSAVNLALMIPGGFVETRTFPGYRVETIAAFNIFLTGLGFGSLVLAYTIARTGRVGVMPALAGLAYVAVYVLDLAGIFPVAAAPMSTTLAAMECIGALLGLALIAVGLRLAAGTDGKAGTGPALPRSLMLAMGLAGLAIVVFATLSAI